MFPLGVSLLIGGYVLMYYGMMNARNGGKGPSFSQVLGMSQELQVEPVSNNQAPNLTGQPATSVPAPSGGVWV